MANQKPTALGQAPTDLLGGQLEVEYESVSLPNRWVRLDRRH